MVGKIDIHNFEKKFKRELELIQKAEISEHNRQLLLEWKDNLSTKEKLKKPRVIKLLSHVRHIAQLAYKDKELNKDFEFYTDKEIGQIYSMIDADPNKGEWAEHDYRRAFNKFMLWLRDTKGYPKGYRLVVKGREYERNELTKLLLITGRPPEISGFKAKKPKKLKDANQIPIKRHLRYLREAAANPRDKAYFAGSEELGPRIGGWGSRKIKHIMFDELGVKVIMNDKTMNGEPVRLIDAAPFIRNWLENHPFRDDPEAPLWVDLHYTDRPVPLSYAGFRAIIRRATDRHNKKAEKDPTLEKIPRYYSTHDFRYYAETRDQLEGIPEGVRKKQRGWSETSRQPAIYGRLLTKDVDQAWAKRCGIKKDEEEKKEPKRCVQCNYVNPSTATFCMQCRAPLDLKVALKIEEGKNALREMVQTAKMLEAKLDMYKKMTKEMEALRRELEELKAKSKT
jgi:hypothetical protein